MFKKLRVIILLGLVILAVGLPLALAQEEEEFVPFRIRLWEILEQHPEILKQVEALQQKYALPQSEEGFGPGRGPLGHRGWGRGAHCRRSFSHYPLRRGGPWFSD